MQLKEEEGLFEVGGLTGRRGEGRVVGACELREPYREVVLEVAVQMLVEILDLFSNLRKRKVDNHGVGKAGRKETLLLALISLVLKPRF